jgi:hypothetical protein
MSETESEERTAGEIADEHGQLLEFGRAVKLLRNAAADLERNGHLTVGAWEAIEKATDDLKVVGNEEMEMAQTMQELHKEHLREGHDHYQHSCPLCEQEDSDE